MEVCPLCLHTWLASSWASLLSAVASRSGVLYAWLPGLPDAVPAGLAVVGRHSRGSLGVGGKIRNDCPI